MMYVLIRGQFLDTYIFEEVITGFADRFYVNVRKK